MSDDYPGPSAYKTPHPIFKGVHEVRSVTDKDTCYEVSLDTGVCTCQHGKAWRWSNKRWVPNSWCNHKIRAIASIVSSCNFASMAPNTEATAQAAYNKLLGERYIIWESVSAFHKELRIGDDKSACYWALSVGSHRGMGGVIRYLLNIIFEETRDLDLYLHLLKLSDKGNHVTYDEAMTAVRLFSKSPKKWQLAPRLDIFLDEMRGYRALAKDYSYAVARGSDIIDFGENAKLEKALIQGLLGGDRTMVQYGLKGLYKSQHPKKLLHLKVQIFNILTDCLNKEGAFSKGSRKWDIDEVYANRLHSLVLRRFHTVGDFGYHELNALCDSLTGESYPDSSNLTPAAQIRLYGARFARYKPPLGVIRAIPLYALDNHNHRGKHLMNRWGATELLPGAAQHNLDFRWCGAYMGVAWRYLAYNQLQRCDVPWGEVKWNRAPWLWKHLSSMWY